MPSYSKTKPANGLEAVISNSLVGMLKVNPVIFPARLVTPLINEYIDTLVIVKKFTLGE